MQSPQSCIPALLAFVLMASTAKADPFAENIRPTPWLAPADEQKTFHLPPGFEIQLVAAEPDINKPMNLAFDSDGRLWVTTSIEYPTFAPTNKPARDRIMIFDDFGPDGRARKVTQFAGRLNIPIGLYPYHSRNADGSVTWKAIAWSIPHIWKLEDTDGDGKSDKQEVLYANFDYTRDTHGDQASFRRGFDGWLYCTHGYNNDSHVQGRDGNEVHMTSGNTYRIRLDGARIEHYTHGQVNPFGLAFDPFGDLFSSDCHSEPIYQLLSGGYYPSFGKPHDGLGFAPQMMQNKRGTTAIDGISIYTDDLWPETYRGNIFIGDVMASRIYRDRVTEVGSTRLSWAMPDFVSSDDPWFRPVDTQLGPDGALYIADFYNRIIGHYEVPHNHPGRDRTSGRIWRVVYRGADGKLADRPLPHFSDKSAAELVVELADPSLIRRRLATDELTDRVGDGAISAIGEALAHPINSFQQAHALWALQRLGQLTPDRIAKASRDPDRLVRTHAMRLLNASSQLGPGERELALAGLSDADALVRRCAAEALGNHPAFDNVRPLLTLVQDTPTNDTHLVYMARKALRDQLVDAGNLQHLAATDLSPTETKLIADLCLSINTWAAAGFLVDQLEAQSLGDIDIVQQAEILKHAARYLDEARMGHLTALLDQTPKTRSKKTGLADLGGRLLLSKAAYEGFDQRGGVFPKNLLASGTNLAMRFLSNYKPGHAWASLPYDPNPTDTPWESQLLACADGKVRPLITSRPHGDDLTGVLRSPTFSAPKRLTFWFGGHDGFVDNPPQHFNRIRLCAASSGQVLMEAFPPRTNIAQIVDWDLSARQGTKAYIEAVDGDDSVEYAWIAFGGFEPALPELAPPDIAPRQALDWLTASAEMAVHTGLKSASPIIGNFCLPPSSPDAVENDPNLIIAFARAWISLDPNQAIPALAGALSANRGSPAYRERIAELLAGQNSAVAQTAVVTAMKGLPQRTQERLSYPLASAPFSAETLLAGIEQGGISPRVLQRIGIINRLRASRPKDWEARVAKLKSRLPAADDERDKLIADFKTFCTTSPGNTQNGRQVFAKNCAICHRIGSEGAVIGPQLDGIGQRGLDRLCEDVLDPNRSVDHAFRTSLLTLKNGDTVSGLVRREEGETIILADSSGKEVTVSKKDVSERQESETSLMPENFGEIIPKADFAHLMAFLLSTAVKQ